MISLHMFCIGCAINTIFAISLNAGNEKPMLFIVGAIVLVGAAIVYHLEKIENKLK